MGINYFEIVKMKIAIPKLETGLPLNSFKEELKRGFFFNANKSFLKIFLFFLFSWMNYARQFMKW